jgi:uncharacterized protein HemX
MSGAATAVYVAAAVAAVGTAYSIYNGEEGRKQQGEAMSQQRQAQSQAKEAATKQEQISEQTVNQANAKSPDASAILSAASQASKGGPAGTMLTGPTGVNQADLSLGKSTLLGG